MCGALSFEVTLIGIVRRWSPTQAPLQSDVNRTQDLAYLLRLQHHVLGKEHQGRPLDSINGSSAGDNKAEHQTSRVVSITLLVQAPKQ